MTAASAHHEPPLELVRGAVRALLGRSSAYGAMPADARRSIAYGTVKVGTMLADPAWLAGPAKSSPVAEAVAELRRRIAPQAELLDQTTGKGFVAGAGREGTAMYTDLVKSVDFPSFVSSLVQGVFQALVNASIQQMTAYQTLVEAIVKSAASFGAENYTEDDAATYLTANYPGTFRAGSGDRKVEAVPGGALEPAAAADLGVPANTSPTDPQAMSRMISGARTALGRQRQQTLATLVMMGINRIVVTNGRINAKVVFDVQAQDSAHHDAQKKTEDDRDSETTTRAGAGGIWGAMGAGISVSSTSRVSTKVSTAVDDSSDSKAQMKAQLSGEVDLSFKSETFPLERLADMNKVTVVQQKAGNSAQGAVS